MGSASEAGQLDPAYKRRLRWRARRGLLENDIILTRFLDRYLSEMTDEQVAGLNQLLDMTDNDLLELLLGRQELEENILTEESRVVLDQIRSC